jgi:hypothetical protein
MTNGRSDDWSRHKTSRAGSLNDRQVRARRARSGRPVSEVMKTSSKISIKISVIWRQQCILAHIKVSERGRMLVPQVDVAVEALSLKLWCVVTREASGSARNSKYWDRLSRAVGKQDRPSAVSESECSLGFWTSPACAKKSTFRAGCNCLNDHRVLVAKDDDYNVDDLWFPFGLAARRSDPPHLES